MIDLCGELDIDIMLDGDIDLIDEHDGELGIEIIAHEQEPTYDGPCEICPSKERQILETSGLLLAENIIIDPIPPEYGLITYNGYEIMVS